MNAKLKSKLTMALAILIYVISGILLTIGHLTEAAGRVIRFDKYAAKASWNKIKGEWQWAR